MALIHQLKTIEKSQNRKASHTLIGISKDEQEEWLWTAFIKGNKLLWMFASSRSRMLNGREIHWQRRDSIPYEIEQYVEELCLQVQALFQSTEVS
ncbi:hypothetical protein [Pontibacillus litoralis]|uniref:Uncharacterized protein n=1 Tax=Pontibacillus litoralis JSM 072002 TaxID=1385512 RepID=A0A0A5G894_9BACI|nr:hypothetical protein [Pontibacillus litoralis]KGX88269.1 hypothetical protein N784_10670 [Pontibacillus litoralis JSM 072002]